jgi:hypothetical protein
MDYREQTFDRLQTFCKEFNDELALYQALAGAARALCTTYVEEGRLADAQKKNETIRGLCNIRSRHRLIRTSPILGEEWDVKFEEERTDLANLELALAETDVFMIGPFVSERKYRETNILLKEVNWLWKGRHPEDARFARWWGWAVMKHAEAFARDGNFEQIGKALDALNEFSSKFPGNLEFAGYRSKIVLVGLKYATEAESFSVAEDLFVTLEKLARECPAEQEPMANWAEGALALCIAYQKIGKMEESMKAPRAAAAALRSEAYRRRFEELPGEQSLEGLYSWLDAIGATDH